MVSGVAKMIDPIGTLTKVEAYLAAWSQEVPRGVTLVGGCGLALLEFVTGFLLLTGSLRRTSAAVAAAIMMFMLALSGYIALENPVSDCGCFGDLWVISNGATFAKNVVLTAPAVYLLRRNQRVGGMFALWSQWLQVAVAVAYMFTVGIIGYHEQPLIDFRPYPVGEPLVDTEGAEVRYVYRSAAGETREFADDELPDESEGWEFVEAREVSPASGKTFAIFDRESGDDVTDAVIGQTGEQMLLLMPEPGDATAAGSFTANELNALMTERYGEGAFIGVTDAKPVEVERAMDLMMTEYPVYYADPKAIKTVARGQMAIVCLRNDTVMWKRTLTSINLDLIGAEGDDPAQVYATHGPEVFMLLTLIFAGAEGALALLGALKISRRRVGMRREVLTCG